MNFFAVTLLLFFSLHCTLAKCAAEDFGISYGACENGRRDVVFYLKKDCEETDDFKLPNPSVRQNISCGGICVNGSHIFNISKNCSNSLTACCTACAAGSEPDVGKYLYAEWDANKKFPSNFKSNTWRQDDVGLTTGVVRANTVATLDIEIDVMNTNNSSNMYVEYIAYYTGEGSSFRLLIDDEPYPSDTASFLPMQSWHYPYIQPLPYGTHKLSFVYRSHDNPNVTSTVEGARISYIQFYGIQHDSTSCLTCPWGQGGSGTRCSYCGINYYTNETTGPGTCRQCPPGSYSLSGADKCAPRVPCTMDDYQVRYSKCENGSVTKTYYEYYPYICDNSTLPEGLVNNTKVPCPLCNPGLYLANDTCVACPAGTYREKITDDDSKCTACPNSTLATRSLYFKTINFTGTESKLFSTECHALLINYADCYSGGDGWVSNNNILTSGNYYTGAVTTTLIANIPGTRASSIEFSFKLFLRKDSSFVYYSGTNGIPVSYNSGQNNKSIKVSLPYSDKNFTWVFHKHEKRAYNNDTGQRFSDYVEMEYIIFHDVDNATGGGITCRPCPGGTISGVGDTSCTWCEAGTYARPGDTSCTPCTNNTYTPSARSEECLPCGEQNIAIPVGESLYNTSCKISSCGLTVNSTHVVDLSPLVMNPRTPRDGDGPVSNETMYGPIEVPGYPVAAFYIGVCSSFRSDIYCSTNYNYSINTLFCETWGKADVFDVGNKTNITFFENFVTGDYGINITYYDGMYYYRWDQEEISGPRSAEVLFVCTPGAGVGKMQGNKTINFTTSPHRYHFRWETQYACRFCLEDDYEPFTGDCYSSKRTTQYVLKVGTKCSGGAQPPIDLVEKCTMPAVSFNGGTLAIIIIAVVVVVTLVIVVLFILVRKNRKLKYQLVQKGLFNSGGVTSSTAGAQGMVSFGKK